MSLMDQVARSGQPLIVTRRGKPLVRVLPAGDRPAEDDYALHGTITLEKDIVSPIAEADWEATS